MDEDLAWLRVQDMQREAENRRLMARTAASGSARANLGVRVVQALTRFIWRKIRSERVAPPAVESRHHA
jgi:hypothetical protein